MSDPALQNTLPAQPVLGGGMAETRKMVLTLSGVAALSGLLIVSVYQLTLPRIEANREALIERAIFTVVPGGVSKSVYGFSGGNLEPNPVNARFGDRYYAVYGEDGGFLGVAVEASGQGYQDVIRILYGYDPEGETVSGMTVLENKETPGLGDKIAKDPRFLSNFEALAAALDPGTGALLHEIVVVGQGKKTAAWEIDGISGATISSKAIGEMIQRSLNENLARLQPQLDVMRKGTS